MNFKDRNKEQPLKKSQEVTKDELVAEGETRTATANDENNLRNQRGRPLKKP